MRSVVCSWWWGCPDGRPLGVCHCAAARKTGSPPMYLLTLRRGPAGSWERGGDFVLGGQVVVEVCTCWLGREEHWVLDNILYYRLSSCAACYMELVSVGIKIIYYFVCGYWAVELCWDWTLNVMHIRITNICKWGTRSIRATFLVASNHHHR
jgi:hypothetical protein